MDTLSKRRALVWGGLMVVLGGLLLLQQTMELSIWVWVAVLAGLALFSLTLAFFGGVDGLLLLTSYILLAVAGLLALPTLGILQDESPVFYILAAVALPFFSVYIWDRSQWWALIPAYVLVAVALMIFLVTNEIIAGFIIPTYVLSAIALPFLVIFLRDFNQWWALITAGILAAIGLGFLFSQNLVQYLGAAVLVILGIVVLARALLGRDQISENETSQSNPIEEQRGEETG